MTTDFPNTGVSILNDFSQRFDLSPGRVIRVEQNVIVKLYVSFLQSGAGVFQTLIERTNLVFTLFSNLHNAELFIHLLTARFEPRPGDRLIFVTIARGVHNLHCLNQLRLPAFVGFVKSLHQFRINLTTTLQIGNTYLQLFILGCQSDIARTTTIRSIIELLQLGSNLSLFFRSLGQITAVGHCTTRTALSHAFKHVREEGFNFRPPRVVLRLRLLVQGLDIFGNSYSSLCSETVIDCLQDLAKLANLLTGLISHKAEFIVFVLSLFHRLVILGECRVYGLLLTIRDDVKTNTRETRQLS